MTKIYPYFLLTIFRKDEYEKDNSSLPIDLAGLVFKYWLRNSDADAGKRMIEIYEKAAASTSSSPEWVIKTLACIGYSTDIEGYYLSLQV